MAGSFYLPFGFKKAAAKVASGIESKTALKTIPVTDFKTTGNLTNDYVRFMMYKEGGLSRDTTDTASSNPSPCEHQGKTGWHTNKGITFTAFQQWAKDKGLKIDCKQFIEMPESVWLEVFNKYYLAPVQKHTDSLILRLALSWVAWGSGVGGANSFLKSFLEENKVAKLDDLKKSIGEKKTFERLIKRRIKNYERIAEKNPTQKKFLKGWVNAVTKFYSLFNSYAK